MIVTTTNNVDGKEVAEYLRVVAGETIFGADVFKDIAASFRNFVGGRSQAYEQELVNARETALAELVQRAQELGADAVIGVKLDYSTVGPNGGMLMVGATGTAVRFA